MRSDNPVVGVTSTWTKIVGQAKSFANQQGISDVEIVEKLLAGEEAKLQELHWLPVKQRITYGQSQQYYYY